MKHLTLLFTAVFMLLGANAEAKLIDRLTNYNYLAYPDIDKYYNKDGDEMAPVIDYSNATTILFDTERDAAGNALQRHIYYYDGYPSTLINDGRSVIGETEVKRLSFSAGEEGLEAGIAKTSCIKKPRGSYQNLHTL